MAQAPIPPETANTPANPKKAAARNPAVDHPGDQPAERAPERRAGGLAQRLPCGLQRFGQEAGDDQEHCAPPRGEAQHG